MNNDNTDSKEIEKLNCKIKNLIKEKYDLRSRIESQNKVIQQLHYKKQAKYEKVACIQGQLEHSLFEVTFKPKENWEEPIQKHKRFPREVFRLPKRVVN